MQRIHAEMAIERALRERVTSIHINKLISSPVSPLFTLAYSTFYIINKRLLFITLLFITKPISQNDHQKINSLGCNTNSQ